MSPEVPEVTVGGKPVTRQYLRLWLGGGVTGYPHHGARLQNVVIETYVSKGRLIRHISHFSNARVLIFAAWVEIHEFDQYPVTVFPLIWIAFEDFLFELG